MALSRTTAKIVRRFLPKKLLRTMMPTLGKKVCSSLSGSSTEMSSENDNETNMLNRAIIIEDEGGEGDDENTDNDIKILEEEEILVMKRDPEEDEKKTSCVWDDDDSWEKNGDALASLIEEGFGDKDNLDPFEEDKIETETETNKSELLLVEPAEEDNGVTEEGTQEMTFGDGALDESQSSENLLKEADFTTEDGYQRYLQVKSNNNKTNNSEIHNNNNKLDRKPKKRIKRGEESSTTATESEGENCGSFIKCNKNNISYALINVRGFTSKKCSINNILTSSDVDFLLLTETHLYQGKKPKVNNYNFFARSRDKINSKGGIAIGFKKELTEHVVKVAEGSGNNEYIIIKITNRKPALVVAVYYGIQENTAQKGNVESNLLELFAMLDKYREQGCDVIVAGDFNVHVGETISGNDGKVSKGGKILNELVEDAGLQYANNIGKGDKRSHVDVSSKTSRALDLIITNIVDKHVRCDVDNDYEMTPYTLRYRKGQSVRNYTDHKAILGEIKGESRRQRRNREQKRKDMKTKQVGWRYNAPGGKERFERETNNRAMEAWEIVDNNDDMDIMYEKIENILTEIKTEVLGKQTTTARRRERERDEDLIVKRIKDVEEAMDGMKKKRINEQVFITRKRLEANNDDDLIEAIDHYKTGQRLETPEDIYKSILDYNQEVLSKNEPANKEVEELMKRKEEDLEVYMNLEDGEDREITIEEFNEVAEQVRVVNKTCYRDFNLAGEQWKYSMFKMFQKIYKTEKIPKEFKKTKLKKLYKKKGDKNKLQNYRFIHLKDWAGKIMEKLVMKKCRDKLDKITPKSQIGGMKESMCAEHLTTLTTMYKMSEKQYGGMAVLLLDIKKCFDKVKLKDTLLDAATAGIHSKDLRMISEIHEDTEISLIGDTTGGKRIIKNTCGQGTQWAPSGSSNMIARTIEVKMKKLGLRREIIDEVVNMILFVDDAAGIAMTIEELRIVGKVLTEALDELALEAHPDKSRILLMGPKKYRDKMKKELETEGVYVQGWEIKTSESETYLGCQISEKGVRSTIDESIERRIRIARNKTIQLIKLLGDDTMNKIGFLQAAKTLFTSIIIPTLTYGVECYIGMNKKQENALETAMKDNLYRLLAISRYAKYSAVLHELGLIPIRHIIKNRKISFVNLLCNYKKSGICLKVITEEDQIYKDGLMQEVRKYCEEYNLPDVTAYRVKKETVKIRIWEKARLLQWADCLRSPKIPIEYTAMRKDRYYMRFHKRQANLIFCYQIGELNLKTNRPGEAKRMQGGIKCLTPGCDKNDEWSHIIECEGYEKVKPYKGELDGRYERLGEVLDRIDKFRYRTFGEGLLTRMTQEERRRFEEKKISLQTDESDKK